MSKKLPYTPVATTLEEIYSFKDRAFEAYMNSESALETAPDNLVRLAADMDTSAHPLVAYSAGWAVAEAALHRPRGDNPVHLPLEQRLGWLITSADYWEQASEGFLEVCDRTEAATKHSYLDAMNIRSMMALGSLPAMNTVAHWLEEEHQAPEEVVVASQKTRAALVGIAEDILDTEAFTEQHAHARVGIGHEITTSIMLQGARANSNGLVLPSSFRNYSGLRNVAMRHDLVNIPSPHIHPRRTHVQVVTKTPHELADAPRDAPGRMLVVNAHEDLRTDPRGSAVHTLRIIIDYEKRQERWPRSLRRVVAALAQRVAKNRE